MKYIAILLVVAIVQTTAFQHKSQVQHQQEHQQNWQYDDNVLILHSGNFDHALKHFHTLLVDFYAPWCPHCQKLQPEFAQAARELQADDVTLAKVDCTREHKLADRFDIGGYPTLKIFSNKVEYKYHGRRTHEHIVEYMRNHKEFERLASQQDLQQKFTMIRDQSKEFLTNNNKKTDKPKFIRKIRENINI